MRAILLVHIISSMSNMKKIIVTVLLIGSIIASTLCVLAILSIAEDRRAYAECTKWEWMDREFPAFEWSELMIEQCAYVGYETKIK